MSCDREHYYNICGFLSDQEVHKIWNIIDNALERQGYNADNGELSIRVYDEELTEDVEYNHEFYSSLSEGKDQPQPVDKAAHGHVRKDLDAL